jgi:hypothetical protein
VHFRAAHEIGLEAFARLSRERASARQASEHPYAH